ncbi:ABC transporter ATP-binding protein [Sphingomonas sp.]|uniref:ABC transporter ATP-binding protein n=1 Tax=Sphingomonas sp. TaxID=28214 RepID=UPI001B138218|nr:ABC transporter ATP-binding protein [Sphingomonas sp.]MBO9713398.1 ABC transporter ATP-binding protein [Sphingomonas sp.]
MAEIWDPAFSTPRCRTTNGASQCGFPILRVSLETELLYRSRKVMKSVSDHLALRRIPAVAGLQHPAAFVRASLGAIGPDRKLLLFAVILASISGACQTVLLPLLALIGIALSSLTPPPHLAWLNWIPRDATIMSLIGVSGILVFAVMIIAVPLARLHASIGARAVARARERLLVAFLNSTSAYRRTLDEGNLQRLIGEYCQYLSNTVLSFTTFCVSGVTLSVLVIVPLCVNPKVGSVELLMILASVMFYATVAKRVRQHSIERTAINRGLSTLTAQVSRIADEIETFDVGRTVSHQLNHRVRGAADSLRQIIFYDSLLPTVFQFGALGMILAVIASVITIVPGQHPGIAAVALLLLRVLIYGRQMLASLQQGGTISPYIEKIEAEIAAMEANRHSRLGDQVHVFDGLRLRDVSFAYRPDQAVLRTFSLDVAPGEAIAVVGSSGGGKSTLCALLLGLQPPSSGSITSNGVAVTDIPADAWARTAAYVPQDCKLIAASIADNIRFYRDDRSDLDVEAAARAAHLHDEILSLPDGYRTLVGPGAQELSGGQRQRLAIARALLDRPKLLVLDEPSSALDRHSEAMIGKTLVELKGETTLILTTHRHRTLRICDRVLTLENGIVSEVEAGALRSGAL